MGRPNSGLLHPPVVTRRPGRSPSKSLRTLGWLLGWCGVVTSLSLARAAGPADLWPAQPTKTSDVATLPARLAALDAAAATLPPELGPAVRCEQAFLRAVSRAPEAEWLPPLRGLAATTAGDPVSAGVREVAKAWIARSQLASIGETLDQYYAANVRYPAALAEVEKNLPSELKLDPWGEAWVYQPRAPQGFAREARQRYQLGPKRLPALGLFREATGSRRNFAPPAWKLALRVAGNNRALEFQQNGVVAGLITAGGKIDAYTLLYVGDHWALMSAPDQLFTVAF